MKKFLAMLLVGVMTMTAGCGGMEEKADYIVSVSGELIGEDLESAGIDEEAVKHRYSLMKMYVISMTEEEARDIETLDKVNHVEKDREVSIPDPPDEE